MNITKTNRSIMYVLAMAAITAMLACVAAFTTPSQAYAEVDMDGKEIMEMHRLYNPNSGEHFFTGDAAERDGLVAIGWEYEGVGWLAPVPNAYQEPSQPRVYRVYNPYAGEHHYTGQASERDELVAAGWVDEGVGWYNCYTLRIGVYRQYNPNEPSNNHNYTTSAEERDYLLSLGWVDEGIGWFGTITQEQYDLNKANYEATHVHDWQPITNTVTTHDMVESYYNEYVTADLHWFKTEEEALAHANELDKSMYADWEWPYKTVVMSEMVPGPEYEVTTTLYYRCWPCSKDISVEEYEALMAEQQG